MRTLPIVFEIKGSHLEKNSPMKATVPTEDTMPSGGSLERKSEEEAANSWHPVPGSFASLAEQSCLSVDDRTMYVLCLPEESEGPCGTDWKMVLIGSVSQCGLYLG